MDTLAENIEALSQSDDVRIRYEAVDQLRSHTHRPEVVDALVEALGDDGYYEIPEPGAPGHVYAVSSRAREALASVTPGLFHKLAAKMKSDPRAIRCCLSMMPSYGEDGFGVLEEALDHPDPDIPGIAATVLANMLDAVDGDADHRLLETVLRAMVNKNVFARASSIDKLRYFYPERPHLDPVQTLPAGFEAELAQAVRSGQTRADAAWPFLSSALLLEACVERTARGDSPSAYQLKNHLARLDNNAIERLLNGLPTEGLLALWGQLGERAASSVPALLEASHNPNLQCAAVLALLQIPSGASRVLPQINDYFLAKEEIRAGIVRFHPEPEKLAAVVIPRLLAQWKVINDECRLRGKRAYASQLAPLRGLQEVAPWMSSEMPWLMSQLEPYGVDPIPRSYAVGILGALGKDAREAFDKLAVLLESTDERSSVLRTLKKLGPIAAERFLGPLEELEAESQSRTRKQDNREGNLIADTLAALRGELPGGDWETG